MSDAPAEDPNEKRSHLALLIAAGAYAEMSAARIVADATLIALVKAGAIPHNMANDLISSAAAALKADTASMPPASRELVEKALVALLGRLQAIAGAASAVPLSEGVH